MIAGPSQTGAAPRNRRTAGGTLLALAFGAATATPVRAANAPPATGEPPPPAIGSPARTPPPRTGPLLKQAEAALTDGRFDAAERLAREAIEGGETLAHAWRVAGLAAFRAGRMEEARRWFEEDRRRETDPSAVAVAAFNLAGAEFKLERWAEAERDYLAAATDAELAPLATLNAAMAADNDERWSRAIELYRHAADLAAKGGQPALVGRAHDRQADAEQQQRGAQRDEAWRLARAGSAALKDGRVDEAVATIERALSAAVAGGMTPTDRADLDYALGHALLSAHREREAALSFRRAIEVVPGDAEYHYMLGVALDRGQDAAGARAEFRRALDAGLRNEDAARARAYLARASRTDERRLLVETQLSGGYDSHYAGGRDAPFMQSGLRAGAAEGAPFVAAEVEPRLRLLGAAANGLVLGDRLNALLYTSSDADPYSLFDETLYLEATSTPRDFVTLSATAEGYLQTAGVRTFGLYQTGGQLALRALFLEGELFATRLHYALTYMHALQDTPERDYRYMTGWRHEAAIKQSVYPGRFRLSLGYLFTAELVGTQTEAVADAIGTDRDEMLREALGLPGSVEPVFSIPYSYLGHALSFDATGPIGAGIRLAFGVRLERRNYLHEIAITPDPRTGYHRVRVDDRLAFDLSLRRPLFLGVEGRVSAYLLFSRSTIDNTDPTSPYDFDDKNYLRFVGSFDLLRTF